MKKTTVRIDDHIHTTLERIARQRGLSLNYLINYALVRFVSFEEAFQMLEERSRRANSGAMRKLLQRTAIKKLSPLQSPSVLTMSSRGMGGFRRFRQFSTTCFVD